MYTNVNFSAPLGVLMFLGTGFLMFLAGAFLIYSLIVRKFGRVRLAVLAGLLIAGVYLAIVLVFSFSSNEKVLARGEEKHFCEIDCHLAYSIVDVRRTKTIGTAPNQATAGGLFAIVTVKTRFDETTISPRRGDALLTPNSRVVTVIDDQGRSYGPSAVGQNILEQSALSPPLTTALRPGESYTTTLVFDLPAETRNPTLLVHEGEWVTHLIIGHENSPLHKKTKFQL